MKTTVIEQMVVKLNGDSSNYDKMLSKAVKNLDAARRNLGAVGRETAPGLAQSLTSAFQKAQAAHQEMVSRVSTNQEKMRAKMSAQQQKALSKAIAIDEKARVQEQKALAKSQRDQEKALKAETKEFAKQQKVKEAALRRMGTSIQWLGGRLTLFGGQLSSWLTGPLVRFATQGLQELTGGHNHLSNSMKILSAQIARDLLPYLNQLARVIYYLIGQWAKLTPEQKRTALTIGLIVVAIGPALKILAVFLNTVSLVVFALGALIPVVVSVVTGLLGFFAAVKGVLFMTVSFSAIIKGLLGLLVGFVKGLVLAIIWIVKITFLVVVWAAAIALIGAAVVLVTDLILNMTGKGNLGILDLVQNFRIGGQRIQTHMQAMFANILMKMDLMVLDLKMAWEDFTFYMSDTKAFKFALKGLQSFAIDALEALDKATFRTRPDIRKQINSIWKDVNDAETGGGKRNTDHMARMKDLLNQYESRRAAGVAAIEEIFKGDSDHAKASGAGKGTSGFKNPFTKLMDWFKSFIGSIKLPDEKTINTSDTAVSRRNAEGAVSRSEGNFQMVSLRRFALEGSGGLARPVKKQEVEDKNMAHKMDEVIRAIQNAPQTAIAG